jgi:hypothetical protein
VGFLPWAGAATSVRITRCLVLCDKPRVWNHNIIGSLLGCYLLWLFSWTWWRDGSTESWATAKTSLWFGSFLYKSWSGNDEQGEGLLLIFSMVNMVLLLSLQWNQSGQWLISSSAQSGKLFVCNNYIVLSCHGMQLQSTSGSFYSSLIPLVSAVLLLVKLVVSLGNWGLAFLAWFLGCLFPCAGPGKQARYCSRRLHERALHFARWCPCFPQQGEGTHLKVKKKVWWRQPIQLCAFHFRGLNCWVVWNK